MFPLRFSLVQLLLITMLVAIVAGAYVAVREHTGVSEPNVVEFFHDSPRLLLASLNQSDEVEIWDCSRPGSRPRRVSIAKALSPYATVMMIQPLGGNLVFLQTNVGLAVNENVMFDLSTQKVEYRWRSSMSSVIAVTPDGEYSATLHQVGNVGAGPTVTIRRHQDSTSVADITPNSGESISVAGDLSNDGSRFIWGTYDGKYHEAKLYPGQSPAYATTEIYTPPAGNPLSLRRFTHPLAGGVNAEAMRAVTSDVNGGRIGFIDLASSTQQAVSVDNASFWDARWSSDGKRVLMNGYASINVYDTTSTKLLLEIPTLETQSAGDSASNYFEVRTGPATLSPDGRWVVVQRENRLSLWNVDSGEERLLNRDSGRWRQFFIYWGASVVWAAMWGWENKRRLQSESAARNSPRIAHLPFGKHPLQIPVGLIVLLLVGLAIGVLFGVDSQRGWAMLWASLASTSGMAVLVVFGIFGMVIWQRIRGVNTFVADEKNKLRNLSRRPVETIQLGEDVELWTVGHCEFPQHIANILPRLNAWEDSFYEVEPLAAPRVLFVFERYEDYERHLGHPLYRGFGIRVYPPHVCWFICEEFFRKTASPVDLVAEFLAASCMTQHYQREGLPTWFIGVNAQLTTNELCDDARDFAPHGHLRLQRWLKPTDDVWQILNVTLHECVNQYSLEYIATKNQRPTVEGLRTGVQCDDLYSSLADYLASDPDRRARWKAFVNAVLRVDSLNEGDFERLFAEHLGASGSEFGRAWLAWILAQPVSELEPLSPDALRAMHESIVPTLLDRTASPEHVRVAIRAAGLRGCLLPVPALIEIARNRPEHRDWAIWALEEILGRSHGEDFAAWKTVYEAAQQRESHSDSPSIRDVASSQIPPRESVTQSSAHIAPQALVWSWRLFFGGGVVSLGLAMAILFWQSAYLLLIFVALLFLAPLGVRMIAASVSQRTDREMDNLRNTQRLLILGGDVVNFVLSFVVGRLLDRPEVKEFRRLHA